MADEIIISAIDLKNLDEKQEKLGDMLKSEMEKAVNDVMYKSASYTSGNSATQSPYPSPFLSLSDTMIPRTTGEIFRWCKYFYTFDPLIAGAVNALSTFPVTEVFLEEMTSDEESDREESETLKTYKKVFFQKINIHKLLIEIGIDYFLYGNCFIFGEMGLDPVSGQMEWKHMIRLDPSKIVIDHNAITREKKYKWTVPDSIFRIVKNGKPKDEYDKIPPIIRDAIKKHNSILLNPNNIFHFSRPADSMGDNSIWGTPVIANVLKLLMYRNILRQAQEAIAREHIIPMRVYYLEKTADYNPNANWNAVAAAFAGELMKTVRDPNHKVVSPVPVGVLNIGGEGKSLMLTAEIEQVQSEILAGMNMPREFLFGGVSYSGSSISLKILENQFITYRLLQADFMQNFVIKNMAKARKEWVSEKDDASLIKVKMMDLKMQDDVQQKSLIIQLNQSGKVSNEYMWKTLGLDVDKIKASLKREMMENIDLDTEVKIKQMEAQFLLQAKQIEYESMLQKKKMEVDAQLGINQMDPNQPPQPGQPQQAQQPQPKQAPQAQPQQQGMDAGTNKLKQTAAHLLNVSAGERESFLSTIPENERNVIIKLMEEMKASQKNKQKIENGGDVKIDMRAMPMQKPPQRQSMKS